MVPQKRRRLDPELDLNSKPRISADTKCSESKLNVSTLKDLIRSMDGSEFLKQEIETKCVNVLNKDFSLEILPGFSEPQGDVHFLLQN